MKSIKFKSPLTILMTATVRPTGDTVETVAARLADYARSINFWLTYPDGRIEGVVFCENSGTDLSWLGEVAPLQHVRRPLEILAAPVEFLPRHMHYGYAELGIIDFALANSTLLMGSRYFAKATGRLQFPAFSRLLNAHPEAFKISIDHRNAYRRETGSRYRARTQLMLFETEFFREALANRRDEMIVQGISHIEEFLPGILSPDAQAGLGFLYRWPLECSPLGVGRNGNHYGSLSNRVRSFIRGCCRKTVPSLWI